MGIDGTIDDETPLNDSIGRFLGYQAEWGVHGEDGKSFDGSYYYYEIETEPCKRSDVNFDGDEN